MGTSRTLPMNLWMAVVEHCMQLPEYKAIKEQKRCALFACCSACFPVNGFVADL